MATATTKTIEVTVMKQEQVITLELSQEEAQALSGYLASTVVGNSVFRTLLVGPDGKDANILRSLEKATGKTVGIRRIKDTCNPGCVCLTDVELYKYER